MGFIKANTVPILKEHARKPFSGSLCLLGHPDVYFSRTQLLKMAQVTRARVDPSVPALPSEAAHLAAKGYISGKTLFAAMGFSSMHVLDFSAYEGADLRHDLNDPDLPEHLHGRFDTIIDHGTLEHVFHVPNALRNLHRMVKTGGRVIHCVPTSNAVDHGFYMFSPTFFHDFYSANGWEIDHIYVVSMTPRQETEPFFLSDYQPGDFDEVRYGGLGGGMYFTISITTKSPGATGDRVPQQGAYGRDASWVRAAGG